MKQKQTRAKRSDEFKRAASKLYDSIEGLKRCGMTLEQIIVVLQSTMRRPRKVKK
jgi:hypothetical protein